MSIRTISLLVLLSFFVTTSCLAQECYNWNQGLAQPVHYPSIKGNVCKIKDRLCFVANDKLQVIDITDVNSAVRLSELQLPSMATEILLVDETAYLICESEGLLEIDVSNAANPTIANRYLIGEDLLNFTIVGDYLIVCDYRWDLYVFEFTETGVLSEVIVHRNPMQFSSEQDLFLVGMDNILLLCDGRYFVSFDYTNPQSPVRTDECRSSYMYGFVRTAFGSGKAYLVELDDNMSSGTTFRTSIMNVSAAGFFNITTSFQSSSYGRIFSADGKFIKLENGALKVINASDMRTLADIPLDYYGYYDLHNDRLADISINEGLTLWDVTRWLPFSTGDYRKTMNGSRRGKFRCSTRSESFNDGAGGGGNSTVYTHSFYDYSNPLNAQYVGSANTFSGEYSYSTLGDVRPDWAHIFVNGEHSSYSRFVNIQSSSVIGAVSGSGKVLNENQFWSSPWDVYPEELRRYEIDPISGPRLVATYELDCCASFTSPEENVLILYSDNELKAYDISDIEVFEPLSSILVPFSNQNLWIGRLLVFATADQLFCVDYRNLSEPAAKEFQLAGTISNLDYSNGVLTVFYKGYNSLSGAQLFNLDEKGQLLPLTAVLAGTYDSIAWDDRMGYLGTNNGIELINFSDYQNPVRIGKMGSNAIDVEIINGYLIGGMSVYPMHCAGPTPVDDLQISIVSMAQNYPNPFNPITTIPFSLPKSDQVSLKVYDVRGQLVSTLVDDTISAGDHKFTWQVTDAFGKNVPSGVYFYVLKTSSETKTGKMALVR